MASTRFPGKVLADRTGRPLIRHVYEAAARARCASRVVIATDDERVRAAVEAFGGVCVMTRADHENGTSRLAEAAARLRLDADEIVINVQGDEPEIEPEIIDAGARALIQSDCPMATVAVPIERAEDLANPNVVKVVLRGDGRAMYFSRAPIPYPRDASASGGEPPLRHVGLYAYRRPFLDQYVALAPTRLERTEQLEQLRVLHHGHDIAVAVYHGRAPAGIDTPEQYDAFVARWRAKNT